MLSLGGVRCPLPGRVRTRPCLSDQSGVRAIPGNQRGNQHHGRWSPDDRQIASLSHSERPGVAQLYGMDGTDGGPPPPHGSQPSLRSVCWSPDATAFIEDLLRDHRDIRRTHHGTRYRAARPYSDDRVRVADLVGE